MMTAAVRTRLLARIGFVLLGGLLGLLIFSAARVRALGGHDHIFTFSEISFFQTFNDGYTLLILALAVIGSLLSILKSYSGFSDVIPGFSKTQRQATSAIDEVAQNALEDAEETIESAYDYAVEAMEQAIDVQEETDEYNAQLDELRDELIAYNQLIDKLERKESDRVNASKHINAKNIDSATDFSKYRIFVDKVMQELEINTPTPDPTDVLSRLDVQRQTALTEVRAAYQAFLNSHKEEDAPHVE
ncbi:MAG: hypothetical protein KDJ38_02330 [Gammaproteobacteria bacterium]|nr:hypothetical protein [Gammaproteobacteria bacterium]